MRMEIGLKTLLLILSLWCVSANAQKTLGVDTLRATVTNGNLTLLPNGTGDVDNNGRYVLLPTGALGTATIRDRGASATNTGLGIDGTTGTIDFLIGGTSILDLGASLFDLKIPLQTNSDSDFTTASFSGAVDMGSTLIVGGTTPDASAAAQVDSTTKGFLIPRMTTAQRTAIGTPADGLMVYDTDLDETYSRANGAWVSLQTAASVDTNRERNIIRNSDMWAWQRGGSFSIPAGNSSRTAEGYLCRTNSGASTVTIQSNTDINGGPNILRFSRDATADLAQCGQGLLYHDIADVLATDSVVRVRAQRLQNTTASNRFLIRVYRSDSFSNFSIPFGGGGSIAVQTCNFTFSGSGWETFECPFTGGNQLPASTRTAWIEFGDDGSGNAGDGYQVNWVQWHRGTSDVAFQTKFASKVLERMDLDGYYQQVVSPYCIAVGSTSVHCNINFPVRMVRAPTAIGAAAIRLTDHYAADYTQSGGGYGFVTVATDKGVRFSITGFSGMTQGRFHSQSFSAPYTGTTINFDAEF